MMQEVDGADGALAVRLGYAARPDGKGVAFAAVGADVTRALRIPFSLDVRPALQGRDVTYAATNAALEALLKRGLRRVVLQVLDERLEADLEQRRPVPSPLTVPYVALRCRLNRFNESRVFAGGGALARDLTARARAEVSLDIAA